MSTFTLAMLRFPWCLIWSGLICIFFPAVYLNAQSSDNFRMWKGLVVDSIVIGDSAYIIPETIFITDLRGTNLPIVFKAEGKYLKISHSSHWSDTVVIRYQILNRDPDFRIFSTAMDTGVFQQPELAMSYKFPQSPRVVTPGTKDQVDYAGAFGRGVSFGNNQNLVLNSNLNLQLSGKLGNDIEVNAAISDENLPLQADGNTQQLNEIDKVFVEIKRKNQVLLAGDQQMSPDNTYFLRYLKKYKGIQYATENSLKDGGILATRAFASIARGNFKRQVLEIQEGNQGPYRLTGTGNELFVIILSASEKVYLDGVLLIRGLENDYVIDYNRSEINFTAKRIVNRNSRVVIEFEYSNQSYLKSAMGLQSSYSKNNFSVQWNTYREQDNKSSNTIQDLNTEDKLLLREAGDQVTNLSRPSYRLNTGNTDLNSIRYRLTDTLVNQTVYKNILVISPLPYESGYDAQFFFVGPGQGNYITETQLFTNGRAYRWVAPDPVTQARRGEYEPITTLAAPKQQTQHSVQIEYKPELGFYTKTELSLSDLDLNLFSPKDQQDDIGLAWRQELGYLAKLDREGMSWKNSISVERLNNRFNFFEPFRNPEFQRDWSLDGVSPVKTNELMWTANTQLDHRHFLLGYTFQHFERKAYYSGTRHGWNGQLNYKGTTLKSFGTLVSQAQSEIQGTFSRPRIEISQRLSLKGDHKAGVYWESETNKQYQAPNHQLLPSSFSYRLVKSYVQGTFDRRKFSYQLTHTARIDKRKQEQALYNYFRSQEWQLENQWQLSKNTLWTFTATRRNIQFDQILKESEDLNSGSLILRQSLHTRSNNDLFRFNQTFESGTGQEPSLEYTYLRVNKGQGYYTWIDINEDSVIQVSEFTLAPFQDQGEYVRFAVTNNNFVKTKNHLLLQHIEIDGSKLGPSKKAGLVRKLALTSNLNLAWKQFGSQRFTIPFQDDTSLVGLQAQMRTQIYFNRGKPGYEFQIGQMFNKSKQRLNTGFEARSGIEYFFRSRHKINSRITLESYLAQLQQGNEMQFVELRNYKIQSQVAEPKIQYQSGASSRTAFSYRYKKSVNQFGEEGALIQELKLEIISQPAIKWSFRSAISFVHIDYKGKDNPWLQYSMLQGLRPGKNLLINLNIDREINSTTLLRLGYDARQSEGGRYIQTGRAQVIANF